MAKKRCPACERKVNEAATECPHCKKQLEVVWWEVQGGSGERLLFSGKGSIETIREQLISRQLQLSNRCRQYIEKLDRVVEGQDLYSLKKEMEWRSLRDYANKVFDLQKLYNPVEAYGKRSARITWAVVGAITAIAWNTSGLLMYGASPVVAVLLSILLLLLTPTIIGLIIGSVVISSIYNIPATGMGFRTVFAVLIGLAVGGAAGWTVGYLIGVFIGLGKKKVIA